ncbi:glycogen debranching protein [Ruminococcus sp. AM29-19LB]|nr:glycogen debranching protein [Ruminococcus sp. AF19-4LB]RGH67377.1 glycogen debranching protein [Ruminococcus sp. AM29-5AC]RGH70146.1 glycogen debranching protein [Ruminococcus sp. AM29-1LB]RGH74607.1 glycogen debranching protein [Ruminococcus sp. AM29-19LB]RGH77067.1 glycogen debranching protein [Ruminococcus sp. AM29-10LB]RGH77854.1 glycogen debranching protein [Ruminococcus sp. AM29-1]
MKWIYGRQDWKTLERGLENCYLLTNGLGGFSSLTMTGAVARNDHSVFMACTKAPNHRVNMVHRIKEELGIGESKYVLSTQEFADGTKEEGYRYLTEFSFETFPVWNYLISGVEMEKEIVMAQGSNQIALNYHLKNRGQEEAVLCVTPFFQFEPKGEDLKEDKIFSRQAQKITDVEYDLFFETNGKVEGFQEKKETYFYRYDECDGRRENGTASAVYQIKKRVKPGEETDLTVIYSLESQIGMDAKKLFDIIKEEQIHHQEKLIKTSGLKNKLAQTLVCSADKFLANRESTDGLTILAGFPFFEDWGRDTMIALPGICISTGRFESVKSILRTFAFYEKDGLMPNLFPEGENEPLYNTVDAALLFINCVWLYYEKTQDIKFVEEMYPVMQRIISGYERGTNFNIHMEEDGLISAGAGLDQVTWMDVRVGEILPTPRHGKPVEINAYWYNALCIMQKFSEVLKKNEEQKYGELAQKVKESFAREFWMEEKHCLKDVISETKADTQIRCNQIWAVSMPFTMLDEEKERQIVDTVFERLYTPYGLRTLDPKDEEFHASYGGEMIKRDLAYHQGTVWTFPMGGYYLAYLKVNKDSREAKEIVAKQLEVLESAMREGCIGQLPEIYDGEIPVSSKGCFAQAWSVGEILRVYEKLEEE